MFLKTKNFQKLLKLNQLQNYSQLLRLPKFTLAKFKIHFSFISTPTAIKQISIPLFSKMRLLTVFTPQGTISRK